MAYTRVPGVIFTCEYHHPPPLSLPCLSATPHPPFRVCTLCVEPSVCVLFETSFVDGLFVVRVSLICQPAATLGLGCQSWLEHLTTVR